MNMNIPQVNPGKKELDSQLFIVFIYNSELQL
jgi:hypothetical protein